VTDDVDLLARMRGGDEGAFVIMVGRYNDSMLRVARGFVPSRAVAEEVVQDTWIGVLRGLERFEGRSSFKTWLYRILVNRARTTGVHEHRSVPVDDVGPAVDAARFDANGNWATPPDAWPEDIESRVHALGSGALIRGALDDLPDRQRVVVTLRDVEGLSSHEVCEVLDITEGNQRVLLHRWRSQLRQALASEFGMVL